MKRINSLFELRQLPVGETFYHIKNGYFTSYTIVGEHPKIQGVVAVNNSKYSEAACFFEGVLGSFGPETVIVSGEYDSEQIGKYCIDQYKEHIKAVEKYFLSEYL